MNFQPKVFGPPPGKQFAAPKTSFAPKPKPVNDDAAAAAEIELTDLQRDFRSRRDQEQARFVDATDSEYWACFCFQNREQKEAFLDFLKVKHIGDKYLDGMQVAKVLKVPLPMNFPQSRKAKPDKKLADMAMEG